MTIKELLETPEAVALIQKAVMGTVPPGYVMILKSRYDKLVAAHDAYFNILPPRPHRESAEEAISNGLREAGISVVTADGAIMSRPVRDYPHL